MNKSKIFYKLQTIILLAVLVCLVVCFTVGSAFADTELPVLNLENCRDNLEKENLDGYAGVITDFDCISQNKEIFEDYINLDERNVLIPVREDDNRVLAYQLVGFTDEGIAVYPIYAYNKIEKEYVDYENLIRDDTILISEQDKSIMMSTNPSYSDYMFIDVSFCVYAKRYVGDYFKIGAVRMRMTIDYLPTGNPNNNSYIGRYEVYMSPTSKYTLRSFKMTPLLSDDVTVDTTNVTNNHEAAVGTTSFTFKTGLTAQEGAQIGISDASVSIGTSRDISITFGYSISAPTGASSVVQTAVRQEFGQFYGYPLEVTRSGRSNNVLKTHLREDKGKTYTGMYSATHRTSKGDGGLVGLAFSDLSLWAQAGEPSYDADNTETVMLLAAWEGDFNNKVMMAMASSPDGDQYFEDFHSSCSLPNKGFLGGIIIYRENE